MRIGRRDFVFSLAALGFAPPRRLQAVIQNSVSSQKAAERMLTEKEKSKLADFCEQIIPTDEYPGARDLGVVEFIDRTLREAHPDWLILYRSGLESTDLSSQDLYSKPFVRLDSQQQSELLRKMERGELSRLDWFGYECAEFFEMVRDHTMQGYYSHPKYGGNRDKAAWEMIDYEDWWVL
jgi:gluconate 2-dehydrogenase gamma chain